jgi:branched-chain amino acid transport system permease protein
MPLFLAEGGLDLFLITLFNALTEGSTYALIAVGYTMVYGIIQLINFAHGEVYMIGAVVAWWLFVTLQVPLVIAVPIAMAVCALLGLGLDVVAYRPLRHSTRLAALITAIGMSLILQTAVQLILDADFHSFPETTTAEILADDAVGRAEPALDAEVVADLRQGAKPAVAERRGGWVSVSWTTSDGRRPVWIEKDEVHLEQGVPRILNENLLGESELKLPFKDVLIWIAAALMMGGLQMLVQRTKIGRAMRACAQDKTTAALMGVEVNKVIVITFMIGSAMAAVAGVLYSIKVGGNIYFRMGYYPGVIAFAAAVLGGIGDLKGALLGGMLLGFAKAFWATYLPSEYDFAFCFTVMIIVIIFRPYGLLGKAGATRA